MPRPPAKPKVTYRWSLDGRETKAVCKLCGAHFWGYSRNDIYPSSSTHKENCPKIGEWKAEMRRLTALELDQQAEV